MIVSTVGSRHRAAPILHRIFFLVLCALFPALTAAAGPDPATGPLSQAGWQTFESCPRYERPCGPVCMPASFSCCDKASAAICPPGQSCCGTRCGCERCHTCVGDACVPDEECLKREEARSASATGSGAQAVPAATAPGSAVAPGAAAVAPAGAIAAGFGALPASLVVPVLGVGGALAVGLTGGGESSGSTVPVAPSVSP